MYRDKEAFIDNKKVVTTFFLFSCIFVHCVDAIRVCKTFDDYDRPDSENCYDNPDDKLNLTQIVRRWGFTAEEHYITTEDGYEILVVRAYSNITQNNTVVFGPGLQMNSLGFAIRGNKALPYLLGNLGYDVWLINYRGTRYSRRHVNLTTDDNAYWHFSLHEMAVYDLRSTLNTIYKITNKKSFYIGLSVGTTIGYIYSITNPQEAQERLKGMISFSPVGYFSPDIRSIWNIGVPIFPLVRALVYAFLHGENLKRPLVDAFKIFSHSRSLLYLGQTGVNLLGGWNYDQMDPETLPVFFQQTPDSYGIETIKYCFQIQKSGKFEYFDYGKTKNLAIYGQSTPPLYHLSNISIPVTFFVGENDFVAPKEPALKTYSELQESAKCGFYVIADPKWTHVDFMQGRDIVELLYNPVIEVIQNMEANNC